MDYFASNIKFLRERNGYKQAELCSIIDFKQSTWSGYESGFSKPNYKDLLKIIEFFEITASELLEIDLANVNLTENLGMAEKGRNVNLKVNRNVNPNSENALKEAIKECQAKDALIAVKDQLLHAKTQLIESLEAQIKLLQNQLDQMKYTIEEKEKNQHTQRKDRKTA